MQFNLIKEILTGGITGYITNSIAIKMIFREYGIGKLKLGGVIIKTRDEFIHNISSLVEREIINTETLGGELSKGAFRESIGKFVKDLIEVQLYKNTADSKLGDLQGYEQSANKLGEFIESSALQNLNSTFDKVLKQISFEDILSEKQFNHISQQLFNITIDLFNREKIIDRSIEDFCIENQNKKFGEVFGSDFSQILINNVENTFSDFHIALKDNFDEEIDRVIEETINTLEINKILDLLQQDLLEKRVIDYINEKDSISLSKVIVHKIKEYIVSEEGKELINNFSKEIHGLLKSIDKPVIELLSDNLKDNFEVFFKDKLQYAVKEIILWIESNKGDIEGLIEKAIDDTISSIDDGMKKNMLNLVRDKFLNDVASKFGIVSKITEYLEKSADLDSISRDITSIIINYLKEEKVSDIVCKLDKNNIFTEESFANIINYNINKYIDYIPEDYFCRFLNKKVNEIFNFNLVRLFEEQAKKPIIVALKNKYIYTDKITKVVIGEITKKITGINSVSFDELIGEQSMASTYSDIGKFILKKVDENRDNLIQLLSQELKNSVYNIDFYNSIEKEFKNNIFNGIVEEISKKAKVTFEDCKKIELKTIWDKIGKVENINESMTNSIVSMLKGNLQYILTGNIKKAVSTNLRDLKDEELQVMIEDFMGKEMKPITVLGALLGAVIGIGMYFFDNSVTQYNYLTAVLISVIVYGFVGWLTNVQALEMLFKPYYEKRVLGIKIPFTPGVIVSRKPKFAKSMSIFVDEELLKKSSMEEIFNKNRDDIFKALKETLSKNDYKIVSEFFNNHLDSIVEESFKILKNSIQNNKNNVAKLVSNKICSADISKLDLSKIHRELNDVLLKKAKECNNEIYSILENVFKSNKELSKVIPETLKKSIEKYIDNIVENKINNMVSNIDVEEKRNKILSLLSENYENVVNKSVIEHFEEKDLTRWKSSIGNTVISKLTSKEARDKIFSWIEKTASKEFNSNKKIGQLFGGFLTNVIDTNFSYIMDSTVRAIASGMKDNQVTISEVAISTTRESLNFFELMGYNMLGGDSIVSSVVDNLINNKFPAFIDEKKEELKSIMTEFIENKIISGEVSNLDLGLQHTEVIEVINNFIDKNEPKLNDKIISITGNVFNWVTAVKLKELLDVVSIHNVENVLELFNGELNFVSKELKNSIIGNKEKLISEYSKLVCSVLENQILSIKVCDATSGIEKENMREISNKLSEIVINSNALKDNIDGVLNGITGDITEKGLTELIDLNELNSSLASLLESLLQNKEIDKELKKSVNDILDSIIKNNVDLIDISTKDDLFKILMNSILDSASVNFYNIISTIDFRGITEKQINNMEPREIEELFNSFAKKYFNKLKLYGWWGAVFGIHWIISVITTVLYSMSAVKENTKK